LAPLEQAVPVATQAASSSQPLKLRVGLFAGTRLQPRWVHDAFACLAGSDYAELTAIVCREAPPPASPWIWRLYEGVDRAAFRAGPDLGRSVDVARIPHRKWLTWKSGSEPDFAALDLDVAFAVGEFDDHVLDGIARHGVWRFTFGEQRTDSEAFAGFQEVAHGVPLTASSLTVRLSPGTPVRVAYQSWSRTYPFSVARNRARLLRKTSEFAPRALRALQRSGPAWLQRCKPAREAGAAAAAIHNADLARNIVGIARRIGQRGIEKALNVEQWFLAFRFRDERFGDARSVPGDLKGFTRLIPPKDRYWADPFAYEKNGRYYVFFEELLFKTGKAHISVIEVKPDGAVSRPVRVLERDYHLSYPFLVEQDGALFMIPETAQCGTVEVYRCVEFPTRWRLERVLLSGVRCVDATFHRGNDHWWMFVNMGNEQSSVFDDELHIFHAGRLLGEWLPHPMNPVKSDVRCARPAGQFFWRNGALYRPAQICAPLYGSGMSINRVLRLTPLEYAERQVERILPSRKDGLLGVHTLNRAGDMTVVDAFMRRPRF
jgi:hypothetical protein